MCTKNREGKMSTYFYLVIFCFVGNFLQALPSQVLIIRHAEKVHDGIELSLKGRERAAALVPYFLGSTSFLTPPAVIYAARATKEHPSVRPLQTVAPLAKELNIKINQDFDPKQFALMVESIKMNPGYKDKVILICWEHSVIPKIVELFGVTTAPQKWLGEVYDRVWIIKFLPSGKINFENITQQLMYGDANK